MTAAELLEDDNTLGVSRLEELHALLDEFHQTQPGTRMPPAPVLAGERPVGRQVT